MGLCLCMNQIPNSAGLFAHYLSSRLGPRTKTIAPKCSNQEFWYGQIPRLVPNYCRGKRGGPPLQRDLLWFWLYIKKPFWRSSFGAPTLTPQVYRSIDTLGWQLTWLDPEAPQWQSWGSSIRCRQRGQSRMTKQFLWCQSQYRPRWSTRFCL